jgi:hypothetical protein
MGSIQSDPERMEFKIGIFRLRDGVVRATTSKP